MVDSVELMNRQLKLLETMEKRFNSMRKTQEDTNKVEEKAVKVAKNRGQAVSMLTKQLEKQERSFNLISNSVSGTIETFKEFQKITGQGKFVAGLEYIDLILSSSSQNVKVFGVEVATARKILYGFLPPGTFRVLNKLSTGIRFTTQTIRSMNSSGEEANNIFTTLFKGFTKISGLKPLLKYQQMARSDLAASKRKFAESEEIAQATYSRGGEALKAAQYGQRLQTRSETYAKRGEFSFKNLGKLAVLGDMFEKGGALSLRKDDRAERKRKAKERFKTVKENLKIVAEASWKMWSNAGKMILKVGLMSMRFFILFAFYASLAFIILKPLMPALKEAFNWAIQTFAYGLSQVWEGLGFILEGVMMVFSAIFGGGTAQDLLMGLWNVAWGVIKILWGVVSAFLGMIPALLIGLGKGLLGQLKVWFEALILGGSETAKSLTQLAIAAGLIYAWYIGFPLLLAGAIATGVYALSSKVFSFADGGTTKSPVSLVGERGPELVKLPMGSRVYSNKDSKTMLSNSNGGNTFNITINARDTSDTELRRIADKIGQMINNKVTRSVSTTTTF